MARTLAQIDCLALLDVRKFTYRELIEMERVGIIEEDQHVELLEGQLVVTTVNPPHAAAVSHLSRHLNRIFAERGQVISQSPLRLSDDLEDENLPQPDVMLVAGPEKVYADHPHPADVYLLIEVSDSTLAKDRSIKLPLYATNGIPELWIVNLIDQQIETYTDPQGEAYLTQTIQPLTGHVSPQRFPDESHQWLPDGILELLD